MIATDTKELRNTFLLNWFLFFIPTVFLGRDLLSIFWNTIAVIDRMGAVGSSASDSYKLVIYLVEAVFFTIMPIVFLILGTLRQLKVTKHLWPQLKELPKIVVINLWGLIIYAGISLLLSVLPLMSQVELPFFVQSLQIVAYTLSLSGLFVMYLVERKSQKQSK